jgi:twitching motility protein PilT
MTVMSAFAASEFVDLYLSNSFADVKGLAGVSDARVPVPDAWAQDMQTLRERCREAQATTGGPEFSVPYSGRVYRVTHLDSVEAGGTYVLRQSKAEIRRFGSIGIPRHFAEALLAEDAVGLVLICGGFGVGKTTTGASWVVERLERHGGVGLSIEDPIETLIDGVHGKGRCIAINASRQNGGYREHLIRGLRSGVDFIFLGEIRDAETAYEALKAGSNGELIVATFHGQSPIQALERLIALAGEHTPSAANLLADSLLGVLWQNLAAETREDGSSFMRFSVKTLLVAGEGEAGIREKIRNAKLVTLNQDIEQQARSGYWQQSVGDRRR